MMKAENVSLDYGARRVVDAVSLEAGAGQLIGLIGPNGSGKTSLVKCLSGLVGHAGNVELEGKSLSAMGPKTRARSIAYLPQDQVVHWPLDVSEVVALGRMPHRAAFAGPSAADLAATERAMERADIRHLAERNALQLSGGELARVLLARALAVEAPVLLVDEPVSFLDPYHQLQIMEMLRDYAHDGALVIAVLHDLTLAGRFCDRLMMMGEGRLLADGSPADVLSEDHLATGFAITPARGEKAGEGFVIPWRRL